MLNHFHASDYIYIYIYIYNDVSKNQLWSFKFTPESQFKQNVAW